jgi:abequosyltransferase
MSAVKLSICIATFNRARFIGETLDCLIAQLQQDNIDAVEIVVLDGGSADSTQDVVGARCATTRQLRYIRQATNQGVDRDFDRAVELAAGEYCWLMSDDDLLKPGAVRGVLRSLEKNPSLVIVNGEVYNHDFSRLLVPRRLRFEADRTYGPAESSRLFAEVAIYASFIGCVVIKRSVWMERERERYFGSLFIHIGVIFQRPLPGNTIVIAEPFVSVRFGTAGWLPRDFEVWMLLWPSLVWSLPVPSAADKMRVSTEHPWREISRLLFFRAKGAYSPTEYRRWIVPRTHSLRERFVPALIAWLPGVLLNPLALLYLARIRPASAPGDSALGVYQTRHSRYYFTNWLKGLHRAPAGSD